METEVGRPLGFGVVGGTSYVARQAVMPAIRSSPFTRLIGASSRTPERLNEYPLTPGERAYTSLHDMLEDDDIEAVYVPLPNDLHLDVVQACLEAQRHVLCEKPMFLEETHYDLITATAERTGRIVTEAFMTSYHPRMRSFVDQLRNGAWGKVYGMSTSFTGTLAPLEGYRLSPERGGGVLWDVGCYGLHPIVEVLGDKPDLIQTKMTPTGPRGVDATVATYLQYEHADAFIRLSFLSGDSQTVSVWTDSHHLQFDHASTPSAHERGFSVTGIDGTTHRVPTNAADPYRAMIDEVAVAMREGRQPSWNLDRSRAMNGLIRQIRGTFISTLE
jgi:predicted dehydrogenase